MREGLYMKEFADSYIRITPACAGRTRIVLKFIFRKRDHPRVCGKDALQETEKDLMTGSPPRVREGPISIPVFNKFVRITPACAGRTTIDL